MGLMKFSEFNESLDSPYSYVWHNTPATQQAKGMKAMFWKGTFMTKQGLITFSMKPPDITKAVYEVDFHDKKHSFAMNKKGDAFKIMATILAMIKDAVDMDDTPIDRIFFTAEKAEEDGATGRASLYKKMAIKFGSKIGKVTVRDSKYEMAISIKVE